MVGEFEFLIQTAYGERSLDGKTFDKSPEILRKFVNSEAYSELFMELVGNADKAAEFFNGVLPADLANEVDKVIKDNPEALQGKMPSNISQMPVTNSGVTPNNQ